MSDMAKYYKAKYLVVWEEGSHHILENGFLEVTGGKITGYRKELPEGAEYEDFGNGIVRAPIHTLINGMNVFSFAISRPPKSIETFFADYHIDRNTDIDYFLIHQANKMIVDRIVKKLKLPVEKVPYNLEEFGNLGGASIPSLMVTRIAERLRTQETTLLMSSFGLGLSWGTMWMRTKPMCIVNEISI